MKLYKKLLPVLFCLLILSGCATPSFDESVPVSSPTETAPSAEQEITVPTVTPSGFREEDIKTDTTVDTTVAETTPAIPAEENPPAQPTVSPTKKPDPTQAPTNNPTATPAPTNKLTATPVPTETPAKEEDPEPSEPVPQFSKEGGFYKNDFKLTLSSPVGGTVYYTLDGTDPRTSDTARRYTSEIEIYNNTNDPNIYSVITDISLNTYYPPDFNVDKGINVKAVIKYADGTYSPVATNSYFVGKTASYYTNLRVISIVTDADNLFNPDTGAYMVGTSYYAWKNSNDYVPYDPSDVQNPTNYNRDGKESEFPVTIQIFEEGKAVFTTDVGARISGNWSRSSHQKSIRLYARKELSGESKMKYAFFEDLFNYEGKLIKKFDKVTLRNGGGDSLLHFRDAFIQDVAKDLAVDIMASEPYIMFLNGEFWGFYMLREKPEDYYIKSHYGIDDKDVTVIKNGSLDSGEWENLEAYRDFCNWVTTADMTKTANYKKFCEQMDVQSFIDYMAVETYVNNSDWATGYMNNWMVWRSEIVDPSLEKADKKWRFILYDMDNSSGIWDGDSHSPYYDSLGAIGVEWSDFNLPAMLRNLCTNKDFKEAFYKGYLNVIENTFAYDKVKAMLEEYVSSYKAATKATQYRYNSGWAADSYDKNATSFLKFFEVRPKYAKEYLEIYCGLKEWEDPTTVNGSREYPPSEWWYWGGAEFSVDYGKEEFHAHVPAVLPNTWEAQAGASGLAFEAGARYRVSFDASCNGSGEFQVIVNRYDGSGYPTIVVDDLTLTKDIAHYDCDFIMTLDSNTDFSLCFNFGGSTGDFVVKNVTVSELK